MACHNNILNLTPYIIMWQYWYSMLNFYLCATNNILNVNSLPNTWSWSYCKIMRQIFSFSRIYVLPEDSVPYWWSKHYVIHDVKSARIYKINKFNFSRGDGLPDWHRRFHYKILPWCDVGERIFTVGKRCLVLKEKKWQEKEWYDI